MTTQARTVALVGRPNVGKSRLFNRLVGRRLAIVHDQPGVTRDVQAADAPEGAFTVLDTGGLGLAAGMSPKQIVEAAEVQVDLAIAAAAVICFVVDGREGLSPMDEIVAAQLRRTGKPVVLVINKVDRPMEESDAAPFRRLGFRDWMAVSAEHGFGENRLRDRLLQLLGPVPPAPAADPRARTALCIAGRPNVGKSSLVNRLLGQERMVVSEVAGTTRDAVAVDFDYPAPDGSVWPFRLTDTAGRRRQNSVDTPVEFFSNARARDALEAAQVVAVVLDAKEGLTTLDKTIAGEALSLGKALVIVVNKWDLALHAFRKDDGVDGYDTERDFRRAYIARIQSELFYAPNCPVVFTSALTGHALRELLEVVRRVDQGLDQQFGTGRLNAVIARLTERKAPKMVGPRRFKVYYAVQVGTRPYTLRLFCNREAALDEQYRRYLEKGLVEEFRLEAAPLRFHLVGKPPRDPSAPRKRRAPAGPNPADALTD